MEQIQNSNLNNNSSNIQYPMPKKLAVIYTDAEREYFSTEELYITEKDAERDANLIATYVEKLGIECKTIPADEYMIQNLKSFDPEMVINLGESVRGSDYLAATIPGILDYLDISYTGTDFFGYAFNTDKFLIKKALQQVGVPVPNYQLFTSPNDPIDMNLRFPPISKLNEIHCAVEITKDSVSENEKHLRERLKFLINTYKQPVIVGEFIAGREVTAILLEGVNRKVYFGEKVFTKQADKYMFTTFEDQWLTTEEVFKYEKYDDPILREHVKKAFDVTKMMDYGKFDIRLDQSGRYYFIDANCNPAFGPKEMQVAIASILDMYGISFTEILRRLIVNTLYVTDEKPENGNGNGNTNVHMSSNGNGNSINGNEHALQVQNETKAIQEITN